MIDSIHEAIHPFVELMTVKPLIPYYLTLSIRPQSSATCLLSVGVKTTYPVEIPKDMRKL